MEIQKILFSHLDKILSSWMLLDQEDHILHWSTQAQGYLGYSLVEIQGRHFSHILPMDHLHRDTYLEDLLIVNGSRTIVDHKVRLQAQSGILMDAEMSLHLIEEEGISYKLILFEKITEIEELRQFANNKTQQLLDEFHFSEGMDLSQETSEIIDAVLVAVTAGHGLGFNRAFVLLVDHSEKCLKGIQAIGPNDMEEAGRIYTSVNQAPRTLAKMIRHYQSNKIDSDRRVNQIVNQLTIPLFQVDHLLIQTLYGQRYIIINDESPLKDNPSFDSLRKTLETHECLLMPMIWHGRSIGLMILDNAFTKQPISDQLIKRLQRFVKVAVDVIVSVRLLTRLEDSISHVQRSNQIIKESQELLLHQEKLSIRGQMIEQMAHEVRGPLSIIGGFASRVYNKMQPEDENHRSMARIVETCKTLELVLNDILKTEPEEQNISQETDGSRCITKVLSLLDEYIKTNKVSVNLNLQGDLPRLKISEHQLFEIFTNLIKNAIEAMPGGGILSVQAIIQAMQVRFTVQDTGHGIPNSIKNQIFSPYFTTKPKGTGLGLVVVKTLVEKNGGTLTLISEENQGTTFMITLPSASEGEKK